jgi:hypothetical protein
MTDRILELHLPSELFERVRELASEHHVSVESYVIDAVQSLVRSDRLLSVQRDLLAAFSDEQLWEIVRRSLPEADEIRRQALLEANRTGQLTVEEAAELDALVERIDALMLVRSQAFSLLQERGYDIPSYLKLTG